MEALYNNKIKRILLVAFVYYISLLPSQFLLNLLPGTELRLSAFIPVVGGILFGWPAAIGVSLGNLICDFITYGATTGPLIFVGSFLNGASALLAYYAFTIINNSKAKASNPQGLYYDYVYNVRSLISYIVTVLISQIFLAVGISAVLVRYGGIDFLSNFRIVLLSNIEICMLLGLPVIIYLPRVDSRNRSITYTLKFRMFATLVMTSIILAVVIAAMMMFVFMDIEQRTPEMNKEALAYIFKINGILLMILTLIFAFLGWIIETKLTRPLGQISGILRNDDDEKYNELDILSNHIDFKVGDSDLLYGNEYSLYVGLTARDCNKEYSPKYAREIIGNICLKYVSGYFSQEQAIGGYKGDEGNANEQVLVYKIFGANDEQIENICKDIKSQLNQESILIEKNKMTRWYY